MTLAQLLRGKYQLNREHLHLLKNLSNHFHKYGEEHEAYNLDDLKNAVFKLEVSKDVNFSSYSELIKLTKSVDEKYDYYYSLALQLSEIGILHHTKGKQQEWFVLNQLLRNKMFHNNLKNLI